MIVTGVLLVQADPRSTRSLRRYVQGSIYQFITILSIQRLRCTTNQQMKQTNNYTFICQIKIYRNALALTTPKMQVNDKKIYFYRHSLGSCVLYVKTLIYRWLLIENITLLYFSFVHYCRGPQAIIKQCQSQFQSI